MSESKYVYEHMQEQEIHVDFTDAIHIEKMGYMIWEVIFIRRLGEWAAGSEGEGEIRQMVLEAAR